MARVFDQVWQPFQSGTSLNEADLVAWESATGVWLPSDYRSFMLRCNGGVLRPFAFVSPDPTLTMGDAFDVLNYMFEWREVLKRSQVRLDAASRNIPPGRLAIATTGSELTVTLCTDEQRFGAVDLWPTTLLHTWGEAPNTRVVPLAPNFSAFIDLLHDIEGAPHYYWARVDPADPIPQQVMLP